MNRQLCICDVEPVYLKRLASYLNRKPEFFWKIKTYTELEWCLRERPDVLLVSGSALEMWAQKKKTTDYPEIIGTKMIFLEDNQKNPGKWPAVCKYQAAGMVYEDLLEILAEEIRLKTEVIGVYGPSNGQEAEKLAKEIGRTYAENGEVLIVTLVEFSTFLGEKLDGNGIGEWFYYYSQQIKEKNRLSDWVITEEKLNFLPGFRTVYDRRGLTLDDWQNFFKEGLRKSRYQTVILVFDRMPEYLELFIWCDSIYVDWGRDGYGNLRKQRFEKMASYMDIQELMKKFIEQ